MDASDYLGHDAPKELLKALLELISEETSIHERWISWHDEPGAYILRLYSKDNLIGIQIYDSCKPSFELRNEDSFLEKQIEELCFEVIVERKLFIKELIYAFSRILEKIGIQSYEDNWFKFPLVELKNLKKIMEQLP